MRSKIALFLGLSMLILFSLACQMAGGPLNSIFATMTPTFTVTPTFTPTRTPSPTPLPTGVHIEQQPDQSTKVIDYEGGYILQFSEDWTVLPGDIDSLKENIDTLVESNPEVADMMEQFQQIDNQALRVIGLNTNREYREGTLLPNILVLTLRDNIGSALPMDMLVEMNVEQLRRNLSISEVLSSSNDINQNQVEYGHIELKTSVMQNGRPVDAWQNLLIVTHGPYTTLFSLTLPLAKQESGQTLVQELIDSLEKLDEK
jgi:hypothetical protein